MTTAERNRAIKQALQAAFAPAKVSVTGDRGTAYGWVNVKIDITPLDVDVRRELTSKVWDTLAAAQLSDTIGTYGYDDPGSDYGYGKKLNISFNQPQYFRTIKHDDGSMSVMRDSFSDWEMA